MKRGTRNSSVSSGFLDPLEGVRSTLVNDVIKMLEDKRRFSFDPLESPRTVTRGGGRLVMDKGPGFSPALRFEKPAFVARCVRRKERREVIFAKGKSGGGARRRPRRNFYSGVKC